MPCKMSHMKYPGQVSHEESGTQSLLATMNKFVKAVNNMEETIMIPNRLKDMALPAVAVDQRKTSTSSMQSIGQRSPSPPGSPTVNSCLRNPFETSMKPTDNHLMLLPSSSSSSLSSPPPSHEPPADPFKCYKMLHAIKNELVRGPQEEHPEEDADSDTVSKETAAMFRHHLKGLFNVLHQMTHTADGLTSWYQEDIDDASTSSNSSIYSFL